MTADALPHPSAHEATVDHLAEITRRHVSLDPEHFRASTKDAARAVIADATDIALGQGGQQ